MNVLSGGAKIKLEREVKCWIGRCEEAEELGQVGGVLHWIERLC